MDKILVVFISVNGSMDEASYCLNSILYQDYPELALLITGAYHRNFSIEKLYQTLSSNKRENLKSIWIRLFEETFSPDDGDFKAYKKYAMEYAKANGYHYLCCLRDTEAFYQSHSLSLLMQQWQQSDVMLCGNTVIYDQNNRYCDELVRHLPDTGEKAELDAFLWRTNLFLSEQPERQDGIVSGGILYLPKYDASMRTLPLRLIPEVPFLKSRKYPCYGQMNYTATYLGKRCADILEVRQFTQEEVCRIQNWLRQRLRKQSRKWGCSVSDTYLCEMLLELLVINQQVSRKECLEKFRSTYEQIGSKRIQIVFFCQKYATFPSLKSVYEQALQDDRFEVKLVYIQFSHFHQDTQAADNEMQNYLDAGYPVIGWESYDLAKDSPDLAIFVSPYDEVPEGFSVEEVSKVVRRCVYIPYGLFIDTDVEELIRLRYQLPMYVLAWLVTFDDAHTVQFAQKYLYGKSNMLGIGNPRFDFVRMLPLSEDQEYIDEIRSRAKGRKIVMWNTHHTLHKDDRKKTFSAWEKYGKQVFAYFWKRNDMFLLWRPHPLFRGALRELYGEKEADAFMEEAVSYENVMLDEYRGYSAAFFAADLMITDQSSMLKEFLFTGKPVVVTVIQPEYLIDETIEKCCYVPANTEQLFETLDLLAAGIDSKQKNREEYVQQFQVFGKKSVAENLLDHMYKKLNRELDES